MRIQNRILFILFVWFGIEFLAFALVVREVGMSGALLLGLITTLAGCSVLRRLGMGAALALRNDFRENLANQQIFSEDTFRNGALSAFGAILLILPGFVSDLIGFFLVIPALRRVFSTFQTAPLTKNRYETEPAVIELSRQEWSRVEPTGKPEARH